MRRTDVEDFRARARDLRHREALDTALVALADELDDAGIESLVLKGPALARLLYRPEESRGYRDIDLLVAPADLDAARRALSRLGYEDISAQQGIDDVAGIMHAETWLLSGEGVRPAMVDLHWRLAGWDADPEVAWNALRGRRTSVEIGGRKVTVPDRPALALHIATHAVQDGPRGRKAMGDLTLSIERWPLETWRSAAELAREAGASMALAAGLRLSPEGAALATRLDLPYTDELTALMLRHDARPRGTFHLEALAQARGVRQRLDVVRRSLLPTAAWIAWEYPWASGSRLRILAGYARHLVRTPLWAVRALRFWHGTRRFRSRRPPSGSR